MVPEILIHFFIPYLFLWVNAPPLKGLSVAPHCDFPFVLSIVVCIFEW